MAKPWFSSRKLQGFSCIIAFCFVQAAFVWTEDTAAQPEADTARKKPTILIPILARNKAHSLPYFFGYLETLNYPKDRISLWIRADHSIDNTIPMLKEWVEATQHLYHHVDFQFSETPKVFALEKGPHDWPPARFNHLISLREGALNAARRQWADYLLAIDVDNFLWEPNALDILMRANKTVIAPMLESTTYYSNFWGGISEKGYYKRTKEYVKIVKRNVTGCFQVPMVHSTYLIDLRHKATDDLTYKPLPDFKLDLDDMLTFAHSARAAGVPFHILNTDHFGAMLVPPETHHPLKEELEQMVHTRLETMLEDDSPMAVSKYITLPLERAPDKMGFDQIYMINLERRIERRKRMMASLALLRIEAKIWKAVDGKNLSPDMLREMGIDMLPGYADPYWGRVLTKGEIGCFLSHYYIWQDMVARNLSRVIVFEDDIRFGGRFRPRMASIMAEVAARKLEWDLIYVGRKILHMKEEEYLPGSSQLVKPSYSYWTLSYMLSLEGAKKLLAQKPLGKMVPVDEYLPIMFDKHPEEEWAAQFEPRDLRAFSVDPLLVAPTHYTGEENYISDTETSSIWEELEKGKKDAGKPSARRQNETSSGEETGETMVPAAKGKNTSQDQRKDTPSTVNQIKQEGESSVRESGQKHSVREEL
ncbi:procollagen galactosyltransferase 2-like [Diadema setosum]|uniref:procollagen galactosyltransferase 2-like n=1 Tax=Diadema setosum TaxID=31175 RepID=UPI003B3B29BA